MSQSKIRALPVGTLALLATSVASACPRTGTPGPCHCAEMLMNNFTSGATAAPSATSAIRPHVQPLDQTSLVHVFDDDYSTNPSGMPIMDATITLGDTVRWNWDFGFHSVTSVIGSLEQFDSGDQFQPGTTFDHTFTHVGTFVYYCDIHGFDNGDGTAGGMSGTITVVAPESQWAATSGGDWNLSSNWSGGVPNGVDAAAHLLSSASAQTVFTNAPITLGTLKFDAGQSYLINGTGSLSMEVSSGAAVVNVAGGSHTVAVPMSFNSDTNITVASGASVTIASAATIRANHVVTTSGTTRITAPLSLEAGASLVNSGGTLTIKGAPTLGAGAKVDVTTHSVNVDYHDQSDPSTTIAQQIASAYAGGNWTGSGITTSSSIAGATGVGWKDDPGSQSILVQYANYGDANLDGVVDTSDFTQLASHFGSANIWANGDFNYDGVVNALDFNGLASNFGQTLSGSPVLGALLPEPALLYCACLLASAALRRRVRA